MFLFSEEVLNIDSDDGYTMLWMYLMPLNYALKNGWNAKFYVKYILPQYR